MNKLISILTASVLTASAALPFASTAEDELYIPTLYLKAASDSNDASAISIDPDGTAYVNLRACEEDVTLGGEVYIEDESLTCWDVAPKVKCAAEYIKFVSARDPLDKPLIPYAYAETDDTGKLVQKRHGTMLTINKKYNVINFDCDKQRTTTDSSPLVPYGEKSDDYPLLTFQMSISKDTPVGEYSVYFLTEPEDDPDQRCTSAAMRINGSTIVTPNTRDMKIYVVDYEPGDLNGDDKIDATDASDILVAYSKLSTGAPSGISVSKECAADVNGDRKIDASDASAVLSYYAYVSTTKDEPVKLLEFLKK